MPIVLSMTNASGLRSAGIIDQSVRAGDLDLAVAGGMESMSQAPYLLKDARFGYRMGDAKALDAMIHDGLTNPFSGKHMAHEASEVAEQFTDLGLLLEAVLPR